MSERNSIEKIETHMIQTMDAQGRLDAALSEYSQSIIRLREQVEKKGRRELCPDLASIYYTHGYRLGFLGLLDEALVDLDQAITLYQELVAKENRRELQSELARTYHNRGNTWQDLGRKKKALEDYRRAITLVEHQLEEQERRDLRNILANFLYRRGLVYDESGRWEETVADFQRGLFIYQEVVEEASFQAWSPDPSPAGTVRNPALDDPDRWDEAWIVLHNSNNGKTIKESIMTDTSPGKLPLTQPAESSDGSSRRPSLLTSPPPSEAFSRTSTPDFQGLPLVLDAARKASIKPKDPGSRAPTSPQLPDAGPTSYDREEKIYNPVTDPMPERIGRVKLERLLGQGSMGVVYLGRDELLDLPVALKIMRSDLLVGISSQSLKAWFLHEAKLAIRVNHPNLVRLYDVGDYKDTLYLSYEYIDGGTLEDLLNRTPGRRLGAVQTVRIMKDVLSALGEAARHGIVHRDIKPANILLTAGGQAKVSDLGLAKGLFEGENHALRPNTVMGTPAYMAPEQAFVTRQVDGRADLYAVGVVMFQLLTGHLPFAGLTSREIIQEHQSTAPPDPCLEEPDIPRALGNLILRLMAKEPEKRCQYPEEVIAEMDQLGLAPQKPETDPDPQPPPDEAEQINRTAIRPLALLLIVVMLVLVWVLRNR